MNFPLKSRSWAGCVATGGARADWDEAAHRQSLDDLRDSRTAAATRGLEIEARRKTAQLAEERAKQAQKAFAERQALIAAVDPLAAEIAEVQAKLAAAETSRSMAQSEVDKAEGRARRLRQQQDRIGTETRRLHRVRAALGMAMEISDHTETLAKAGTLRAEVNSLMEAVGRNPATSDNLALVEEAARELEGARAAVNAVATTISFALDPEAAPRVRLDGNALAGPVISVPVVTKSAITVESIGEIAIDPQIRDRAAMIARIENAEEALRRALEDTGTADLPAARRAAAERQELVRRIEATNREIAVLAPKDSARGMPAGLEARERRARELQGRLAKELEILELASLPASSETESRIAALDTDAEATAREIGLAEAAVKSPMVLLDEAAESVRAFAEKSASLQASLTDRKNELSAGRSLTADDELKARAEATTTDAVAAWSAADALERDQGETPEEIDVRIKRLEAIGRQHADDIADLNKQIFGAEKWIEANEGVGVEEMLDAARAEEERRQRAVEDWEEDAKVLELLRDTLRAAESEAKQRYLAPIAQRTEPYLRMLLPEARLRFSEHLDIEGVERQGTTEAFAHLSAGTQEQLAVLTRLAFAELLLDRGRPAAIILDDALVFSDDDRIERMFDILTRAAEKTQIIVLTCRRHLFTRLGAPSLQIAECGGAV
jgi:DNA repair exonuclease SbcCD ATPase subunit